MAYILKLDTGEGEVQRPDWKLVESSIKQLPQKQNIDAIVLYGKNESLMSIGYAAPYGYHITVMAEYDNFEKYILIDPAAERIVVHASVSSPGQGSEVDFRQRFVTEVMALNAAREFCLLGKREKALVWHCPIEDGSADNYKIGEHY